MDRGQSGNGGLYVLSSLGKETYVRSTKQLPSAKFCFGEVRFKGLISITPVIKRGGNDTVHGLYTVKILNPNPVIYSDEVLESLRLDYPDTKFVEGGNSYGVIRFKTNDPHELSVPYGHKLGGDDVSLAPATRNGFLASRNGDVIPEWAFSKTFKEPPQNEAKLFKVVDGKEGYCQVNDLKFIIQL